MIRKILLGLLAVLIIIQFFRPEKNQAEGLSVSDISTVYAIPGDVHDVLKKKCYDCHSNNTVYPWYSNIQPVAWWLDSHVQDGKRHLDFSSFKEYNAEKAAHKLDELVEVLMEDEMPLKSYLIAHPNAKVTQQEKDAIYNWVASLGVLEEE